MATEANNSKNQHLVLVRYTVLVLTPGIMSVLVRTPDLYCCSFGDWEVHSCGDWDHVGPGEDPDLYCCSCGDWEGHSCGDWEGHSCGDWEGHRCGDWEGHSCGDWEGHSCGQFLSPSCVTLPPFTSQAVMFAFCCGGLCSLEVGQGYGCGPLLNPPPFSCFTAGKTFK